MIDVEIDRLIGGAVTGHLVDAIIQQATRTYSANPGSVFSYAVFSACAELGRYFDDEQGMPSPDLARISMATKESLRKLVQTGGLEAESPAASRALAELLGGLYSLRLTLNRSG